MNKSLLVVLALGSALLSSCSSHPSDMRPADKVSSENVAPGTRDTDYTNYGTKTETGHEGHEAHGCQHADKGIEIDHAGIGPILAQHGFA